MNGDSVGGCVHLRLDFSKQIFSFRSSYAMVVGMTCEINKRNKPPAPVYLLLSKSAPVDARPPIYPVVDCERLPIIRAEVIGIDFN